MADKNKIDSTYIQLVQDFIKNGKPNAEAFRKMYNPIMLELDKFSRGEQWTDTKGIEAWHGTPVTNMTHLVSSLKTSDITYDDIQIKLYPQKFDQIEKVETLEKVLNNIWINGRFKYPVASTVKISRLHPYGITKVIHRSDKIIGTVNNLMMGDIIAEAVIPSNFFWDPRAYNIQDCEFMYEVFNVTEKDLKAEDNFDKSVVRQLIEAKQAKKSGGESGETMNRDYNTGQQDSYTLLEVYIKNHISSSKVEIIKSYICDDHILWIIPNPIGELFPYSKLVEHEQPHEFAGKSSAMLTLNIQKFLNKVDAITYNLATQFQNPAKIVSKASGLSPALVAQHGDTPGVTFAVEGNPTEAIHHVIPSPIDRTLLEMVDRKKSDIFLVANISKVEQGDAPGSITTAGGVSSLINQSSIKDSDAKLQYEKYLIGIVDILISYIKSHNQEVEYRIDATNPKSEMEYSFEKINAKDYKEIGHDIKISLPLSQTEKAQKRNEVMTLLSLQAQTGQRLIDPKDALAMLDFPDTNRLIANMMMNEEAEQKQEEIQVAMMSAQLALQNMANAPKGTSIQELVQASVAQAMQTLEDNKKTSGGTGATGKAAMQPR